VVFAGARGTRAQGDDTPPELSDFSLHLLRLRAAQAMERV